MTHPVTITVTLGDQSMQFARVVPNDHMLVEVADRYRQAEAQGGGIPFDLGEALRSVLSHMCRPVPLRS